MVRGMSRRVQRCEASPKGERMSYLLRTCPDCGDRRVVHSTTTRQDERILAGGSRCMPCYIEFSARPLNPPDCSTDNIDEVAVMRLLAGQPVRATVAEKLEAMRRLPVGLSAREIAERLRVSARQVQRYRSMLRGAKVA